MYSPTWLLGYFSYELLFSVYLTPTKQLSTYFYQLLTKCSGKLWNALFRCTHSFLYVTSFNNFPNTHNTHWFIFTTFSLPSNTYPIFWLLLMKIGRLKINNILWGGEKIIHLFLENTYYRWRVKVTGKAIRSRTIESNEVRWNETELNGLS